MGVLKMHFDVKAQYNVTLMHARLYLFPSSEKRIASLLRKWSMRKNKKNLRKRMKTRKKN
jgi:hypothetical protein